jgi:hypothetical protein
MPEPLLLLIGLSVAALAVVRPLLGAAPHEAASDDDRDAAAVRHRVALEALRDVEIDRRAGSLDDAGYAEQRAQAEERAARTRAALDRQPVADRAVRPGPGRRAALLVAGIIGAVLLAGSFVPGAGIANTTVVNRTLAEAQDAESARQDRIRDLTDLLADAPEAETLSALADEYLAGSSSEDLVRAAVTLQLLIELEPERADAYERIMSAYLRAGDAANARAAHRSYAALASADPVEGAFFDGLIALRGENDPDAAMAAFDRFLELAPDDPRSNMIRGLREEAAGR